VLRVQANYAAGKAAIVGLTKTVAKEWGHFNVRCNAIAYGWIDTRLTRSKEGGEAILVGGEKVGWCVDWQDCGACAGLLLYPAFTPFQSRR
jgi:NAD(P)-dependent dehydrogenase (short-subunit alcohol dehydrogenase family)